MADNTRLGVLENAPPWWPNFMPPEFTDEDIQEIKRHCEKILENISKEKGMTPRERWEATLKYEIPDRPLVTNVPWNLALTRVMDCWSDSLKPGIDLWWYPKLFVKSIFAWVARFGIDFPIFYPLTYGETEFSVNSKTKITPYSHPYQYDPPIKTMDDLAHLHLPDVYHDGFFPAHLWVYKKTKEFMKEFGVLDVMPIWMAPATCPLATILCAVMGMEGTLKAWRRNPELVHKCMEFTTQHFVNHAKAVLELEPDTLWCCSLASLSNKLDDYKPYDKYYLEAVRAIAPSKIAWTPSFDQSNTLEYQAQTGSASLGWMPTYETPMEVVVGLARKYKLICGYYNNPLDFLSASKERIIELVKNNIDCGAGPGFIYSNPGVIDYTTPHETIDLIIKTAKEYGREVYNGLR